MLVMFVRTGIRTWHLLTSMDGTGSRGQDFRVELCISSLTSLSDNIVKAGNGGAQSATAADGVAVPRCESASSVSSCLRIVTIVRAQ